ncbi:MAG: hypothetical protein ABIR24_14860 [Verrucomicrobiota bacterium]
MKIRCVAFNTYLLAAALLLGCKSPQEKIDSAQASKEKKELSTVRLHLEGGSEATGLGIPVSILRTSPISMNVDKDSFLDERDVLRAGVADYTGGFVIQIQFNDHGKLVLDAVSASNKGKRMAIMSEFGDSRWLAAPVFSKRITDGVLTFTPDATREEAERIVRGLNNVASKIKKQERFLPGW